MSASNRYQLCPDCAAACDWEEDPVARSKGRLNREYAERDDPRTHRCVTVNCHTAINPLMKLCRACAGRNGLCQRCQGRLSEEQELAAAENPELEAMIDFFLLVVKTYRYDRAQQLFTEEHAEELGPLAVEAARVPLSLLDQRDRRPIWTKVLGKNVYRVRFCTECANLGSTWPLIRKALHCEHFTTGRSPALCALCAAAQKRCESCAIPVG